MSDLRSSMESATDSAIEPSSIDPIAGIDIIRLVISTFPDGKVFSYAEQVGVNTSCNVKVLRDRLERYETRRLFGPRAAPWVAMLDETNEQDILPSIGIILDQTFQPASSTPAPFCCRRSSTIEHCPDWNSDLPTAHTFGQYRDPITFEETATTDPNLMGMDLPDAVRNDESDSPIATSERQPPAPPSGDRPSCVQRLLMPQAQSTRCQLIPLPSDGPGEIMDNTEPASAAPTVKSPMAPETLPRRRRGRPPRGGCELASNITILPAVGFRRRRGRPPRTFARGEGPRLRPRAKCAHSRE